MKTKAFDCVELQHRAGRRIHEATRHMSQQERVAYWEERNRAFRELVAAVRADRETAQN